nr:putative udp-glucose flavonoid 3-o-glucosyltransferase 3 [Quercus suber]
MKKAELVFIPSLGIGHLLSMVEIAKLLVDRDHKLYITVLITKQSFDPKVAAYTESLNLNASTYTEHIHFIDLPQSGSNSLHLAGFVIDLFCATMVDVANEFGVPTYVFFTASAGFLSLVLHLQSLRDGHNQDTSELFKDSDDKLVVPSFVNPVPARAIKLSKEGASLTLDCARRIDDIMKWFDNQPPLSVVFLCFGSMGSLDDNQVREIAQALDQGGFRFLWSLRRPPPKGKIALPTNYENLEEVLPEGFLDQTAGIGKVIVYAEQQLNAFEMGKELNLAVEIILDSRRDFMIDNQIKGEGDD